MAVWKAMSVLIRNNHLQESSLSLVIQKKKKNTNLLLAIVSKHIITRHKMADMECDYDLSNHKTEPPACAVTSWPHDWDQGG